MVGLHLSRRGIGRGFQEPRSNGEVSETIALELVATTEALSLSRLRGRVGVGVFPQNALAKSTRRALAHSQRLSSSGCRRFIIVSPLRQKND
jgi:hypothetical protein